MKIKEQKQKTDLRSQPSEKSSLIPHISPIIYNSLSRKKEKFIPIEEGKLKMYQCGPTVYWIQHIGNMRAGVMTDLIYKTFKFIGYDVTFTRNYTDVGHLTGDNIGDADTGEDRMEKGARREGVTPDEIANKYIKLFDSHVKALKIDDPTYKTRATSYIKEMQEIVKTLIEKGHAYETNKAVYFDVSTFSRYNDLNKHKIEKNITGAGTGEVHDAQKRNPQDFVLWFFKTGVHKNALQYWPSPFNSPEVENGFGFPGWHIECSAMAKATLGKTIDIHIGGVEHVSIHHTNEIAQSECANDAKLANYWLHYEHLLVDNGKMSKSLGNVYSVDDVVAKGFDPLDLRYLFLLAHYRSKQNFTWKSLESAKQARNKILQTVAQLVRSQNTDYNSQKSTSNYKHLPSANCILHTIYLHKFIQHITDDFDIPGAVATMWELIKDETVNNDEKLNTLLAFDTVFDIGIRGTRDRIANFSEKIIEEVNELIAQRNKYRKEKQWEQADKIRTELDKEGIKIEDTSNGTVWY